MFVVTVKFDLVSGTTDAFMPLIKENAALSLSQETGCHQFDICVDPDQPETVFLYEVYDDEAAFKRHMTTPHFATFSAASEGMIADKEVGTYLKLAT